MWTVKVSTRTGWWTKTGNIILSVLKCIVAQSECSKYQGCFYDSAASTFQVSLSTMAIILAYYITFVLTSCKQLVKTRYIFSNADGSCRFSVDNSL